MSRLSADPDLAAVGALVGDRTRALMLAALLEGRPLCAGDLARRAGVAPSTAAGHLGRLVDGALLTCEPRGRERSYRLASPAVVSLLEAMSVLAPRRRVHTTPAAEAAAALRMARTCYDHLAGRLGVAVTEGLIARGLLRRTRPGLAATPRLVAWLAEHGVAPPAGPRPAVRACLDWSERRPHLAGGLGAAVCRLFAAKGWVAPVRDARTVRVTARGQAALARELGVAWP